LARVEAQRALEIDPSLPYAHALLAGMSGYYDFDWKEAKRRYDLVMAYEPVSADVRRSYAVFLFLTGRPHEAIEEVEGVIKEDPLEVMPRMNLHAYLQAVGRDREAYDQLNKVLELDENFAVAHCSLAALQALEGALPEALRSAQKAYSLVPSHPSAIATLAALLRRTGDESGADRLLQKLGPGDAFGAPRGFAIFHLLCGEVDRAANWAEKAIELRWQAFPLCFILNEETGVVVAARPGKPELSRRTICVKTRISIAARTTTDNVN
jgi:Tfp pilus assembly protein PilF